MHKDRVLFLKEFTKELILQSKPRVEPEEEMPVAGTLLEVKKPEEKIPEIKLEESIAELAKPPAAPPTPIKIEKPEIEMKIPTPVEKKPAVRPPVPLKYRVKLVSPIKPLPQVKPMPRPVPAEAMNLGKINYLIQDKRVNMVECPGPGKFALARIDGRTTITKITLSQKEIQDIIKQFSEKAKIPIISGLFKAAVGNLIITAVISELVGNRFIITKITPEFIMQKTAKKQ